MTITTTTGERLGRNLQTCPIWAACAIIFVLTLLCFGWRLGDSPLARTEGHRALPAHIMATTGDWLIPRLCNEVYLRKPPGHYWVLASFEKLTGRADEWSWRMPSVLAFATLAAFLAAMAGRWFGPVAAWVAGGGCFALVALWAQTRSADIDAMNTLASVVACCALLEVGFGASRRRWLWSALAFIGFASVLMLKGPGGLPLPLGALVGGSAANRKWRWLLHPLCWTPLFAGAAVSGGWAWAVHRTIAIQHLQTDMGGVHEAINGMLRFRRAGKALGMAVQLIVFGLPATISMLALPSLWRGDDPRWGAISASNQEAEAKSSMLRATTGAIIAATALYVISGVVNPRYAYPILPLTALPAGAAASAWADGILPERTRGRFKTAMFIMLIAAPCAQLGFTLRVWHDACAPIQLLAAGIACMAAAAAGIQQLRRGSIRNAGLMILILFAALTFPMSEWQAQTRIRESALNAAHMVQGIVNPSETLVTGEYIRNKPELFLYVDRPVNSLGGRLRKPFDLEKSCWVIFSREEWDAWKAEKGNRFSQVVEIPIYRSMAILAHYEAPDRR